MLLESWQFFKEPVLDLIGEWKQHGQVICINTPPVMLLPAHNPIKNRESYNFVEIDTDQNHRRKKVHSLGISDLRVD